MVSPNGRFFGPGSLGIPDGGITAMLLGLGLVALGISRRSVTS